MPTAVAAARQSYADHPMVRLETAPPGPCHAVSLQETLSGTFTACATVILARADDEELKQGEDRQRRLVRRFLQSEEALQEGFASDLERQFHTLGRRVARAYRDLTPAGQDLNDLVVQVLAEADIPTWQQAQLTPAFERHYRRVLETTMDDIRSVVGVGVNLPDPVAREIVATGGRRMGLLDLNRDTRRSLFTALTQAREEGLGPRAAARRIRDHVPAGRFVNAGSRYRATMIARTETKFAQNVSALQTYRNMDVVTGVRAFDAQRGPTDAECEARNGEIYTFDEAEALIASEHPNGTLSLAPHIEEARMVQATSDADLGTNSRAAGEVSGMLAERRRDPNAGFTEYRGDEHLVRFMTAKYGTQAAREVGPEEFRALRGRHLTRGLQKRDYLPGNLEGTSAHRGAHGNGQYYAAGDTQIARSFIRQQDGWTYGAKLTDDAVVESREAIDRAWAEVMGSQELRNSKGITNEMMEWAGVDRARQAALMDVDAFTVGGTSTADASIMAVVNRARLRVDARSLPDGEFDLRGARELDTPRMAKYREATSRLSDHPDALEAYRIPADNERARNAHSVMMGQYREE